MSQEFMMRKTKQTKFGKEGNCFSACLSCLLDMDLEDVPEFLDEDKWLKDLDAWLSKRWYMYVELDWDAKRTFMSWHGDCLVIGCGPSTRGLSHAVIGRMYVNRGRNEFKPVHDPHPDNTFLVELKQVGLIVPTWL